MRSRNPIWKVLLALGCAAAVAACGSSAKHARARSVADSKALQFSACMRSHGVSNFPDPSGGGNINFTPGSGFNPRSPSFQVAQRACQHLMPGPRTPPKMTAAAHAAALEFSKCMRSHGVPGFPDPVAVGSAPPANELALVIRGMMFEPGGSGITPGSPAFRQAAVACGVKGPGGGP